MGIINTQCRVDRFRDGEKGETGIEETRYTLIYDMSYLPLACFSLLFHKCESEKCYPIKYTGKGKL